MQTSVFDIPRDSIQQVVREVYAAPEYNRFVPWDRFWDTLGRLFDRVLAWILSLILPLLPETGMGRVLLIVLVLLLLGVATWIGIMLWRQREARRARRRGVGGEAPEASLRSAEDLAARGRFTEAAHALYAALLATVARRGHVRLHHSKTAGDYVRELRRHAPSLFARFREFARTYEHVIYGLGECDRDRYERLRALALPVVQGSGADA